MHMRCMLALVILAAAGCGGGADKPTSTGQPATVASTTTEQQPPAPAPGLGDAQPLTPGHTYATQLFRPVVSRPLLQGLQVTPAG